MAWAESAQSVTNRIVTTTIGLPAGASTSTLVADHPLHAVPDPAMTVNVWPGIAPAQHAMFDDRSTWCSRFLLLDVLGVEHFLVVRVALFERSGTDAQLLAQGHVGLQLLG